MTVRQRQWLGAIFFALMFGHFGVNAYWSLIELTSLAGSYDGWGARLLPDGRAEIATVDKGGPAAALKPGDEFISINGLTLKDDPQIRSYNLRVRPGTRYTIVVRRQGKLLEFTLTMAARPLSSWLIPIADILVQLLFLITGLVVFLLKPTDRQAWRLALLLGTFAGLFNNIIPYLPLPLLPVMVFARLAGLWALPLFFHFFLIFPDRSPLLQRFPRLERRLYWPFYLITPWFGLSRLTVLLHSHPRWEKIFSELWLLKQRWIGLAALSIAIAYLVAGLGALLVAYRAAGVAARRKILVIVAGSGAGFFNLLVIVVWETFFRARYPKAGDLLDVGLKLTLPLIPLSFAYAIVRHQVIPVSLIIRRGVRYVLVSRGSVLLEGIAVALSVTALLTYVFSRVRSSGLTVGIVSATVGIVTWKLSSRLHDKYLAPLIDRQFFRESYDSHQIIADLSNDLRTVTGMAQLLETVSTKVQSALKSENVTIFLRQPQTGDYLGEYSRDFGAGDASAAPEQTLRIPHYAAVIGALADSGGPIDVEEGEPLELRSSKKDSGQSASVERETLRQVNSALLLPLGTKDNLTGIISLGPRLGDLPYSRGDKHLLMSVAGPTTFAIENAQLVERMIEEARRRQELEAENELRARELEEARQLQLSMLPKTVPQLPHLEIAAYMKTATEVGGDYYDFHLSDTGELTIVVGDATGHGLKAGTVVTATKSLFNHLAGTPDVVEFFHHSSRALKLMNMRALYMAMTIVKIRGYQMTVSSAGMPPIFVYRAADNVVEEVSIKGIPLGSLQNYAYREREVDLNSGDVVVLMSDGFPERFNQDGEMLGYDAAKIVLIENAAASPQVMIERFVGLADQWADGLPQDDDVTFVAFRVR